MRICLFTPNFLPALGGAERMADVLVRQLIARGHDVRVLAQKHPGPEPQLPYPVRRYRRPPLQHLWPEWLSRSLRRAHRDWGFELVLAFYAYPTGYAAARIKQRLGVKVVVNTRGGDLYPNFHGLRKPRVASCIRRGYQTADRIISLSDYTTRRLHEVAGDHLPPIDQVPNGIDLAEFDRLLASAADHRPDFDAGSRFILHLARVSAVKQHHVALAAVARLADVFRQRNLRYLIVGDGNAADEVRQLIDSHRIADVVHMLGSRSGLDKAWLFRNARFFISTSREEGMPNVILEAMAAGLPVLAGDIDPHRELIDDDSWGRLFRTGDADHLAQQLRLMLDADLDRYRAHAMKRRENYSLVKMIDGYERACAAAMAQPSSR